MTLITKQTKAPGELKFWHPNKHMAGNIHIFGRIGSGKTCKLLTIVQYHQAHGSKIWDIWGGSRQEGPFWCFPNDDTFLWKTLEQETYEFSQSGPKQYKVNLLFPMFSKQLPKQLPNNPPNIKSKVFTIPFRELTDRHIALVLGPQGPRNKVIWENILEETNTKSSGEDVKYLIKNKLSGSKNTSLVKLFLKPLIDNHLLSSEHCNLNLDLEAEAEEKDVVTVLCLDYVPREFHFLVMGYIMLKLINLVKEHKIGTKNIAMFREASYFMKIVDSDDTKEIRAKAFRSIIVDDVARYARNGLFLAMDTQDASEVKGLISGQEDIIGVCEMPGEASRMATCDQLKRDRRITSYLIAYIAKLPIQKIVIVERGKNARLISRIQPPRCRYWKVEHGTFFQLWRKEIDKWIDSRQSIDMIEEEYNKRKEINNIMMDKEKRIKEQEPLIQKKVKNNVPKVEVPLVISEQIVITDKELEKEETPNDRYSAPTANFD